MPKWMVGGPLSVALLWFAPMALAESEYWCDAQQVAVDQLPTLAASCPIGDGLWGKPPKRGDSLFWIQCGMLSQPMPLSTVKKLYQQISSDIWLKPEPKGERCLIGPYHDFSSASDDLKKIKKVATFEQAFIRQVLKKSTQPAVMKGKPVADSVSVKAHAVTPDAPSVTAVTTSKKSRQTLPVLVDPAQESSAEPASHASTAPTNSNFVLRKPIQVAGYTFSVPFSDNPQVQFYMEREVAWNRLDYDSAQRVCRSVGMRLVREREWSALLTSQQMQLHQWPVQLPYWGEGNKGLFVTGKISTLKSSSLLNVLCVK